MRRSNIQSLSEVLQEYIREMKMERKLKEVDALHYWEELLGKHRKYLYCPECVVCENKFSGGKKRTDNDA